ncbi:leucine-rich repeat-containing protein 29 [Tachyglossus aculeatus]|uniref:leucine-rich repeat-containing protein 29 n=1 Tax=Tachyglossus aculeatus TaxID=9261 RepID=UPI0018F29940|nr:leucine-rich repeat-containing protein 29 [Tachyglossus aculeatus]
MAELLPPEMLTLILSYLPLSDLKEASLVSWDWYAAALNVMRQMNVLYSIPVSTISVASIKSLGQRGISSVRITHMDSSAASQDGLQAVSYYLGSQLQSLSLNSNHLSVPSFTSLLMGCRTLRTLDLSGANNLFVNGLLLALPTDYQQAQEALSGLRELNLSSLRYLTDLTFNRLCNCAPKLEYISLARCHMLFEYDPNYGTAIPVNSPTTLSFRNLLNFVQERASYLRGLDLSDTKITPEVLASLGEMDGLHLEKLVLQGCRELTDDSVITLCRLQPGLTTLNIDGCTELGDRAVVAVCQGMPRLRHLQIGRLQQLTDYGLSALGRLRELQILHMAECCLICGEGLIQALGAEKILPPITTLNLAYCALVKDVSVLPLVSLLSRTLRTLDLSLCTGLTNKSLHAIFSQLPKLKSLHMAWCKEITDRGLLGLLEYSSEVQDQKGEPLLEPWPSNLAAESEEASTSRRVCYTSISCLSVLQELDLTACCKLTNTSLTMVIKFPQLRKLTLSMIPQLTDAALVSIAQGCPALEQLTLRHCRQLSDAGWIEAAGFLPRLHCLNISGCSQLTERTLRALSSSCRQLKVLDVSLCEGIQLAAIERLRAQLPLVTWVYSHFMGANELKLS